MSRRSPRTSRRGPGLRAARSSRCASGPRCACDRRYRYKRDTTESAAPGRRGVDCTEPETRSEEHTSELQSLRHLVCRLLLEKKKNHKEKPHGGSRSVMQSINLAKPKSRWRLVCGDMSDMLLTNGPSVWTNGDYAVEASECTV